MGPFATFFLHLLAAKIIEPGTTAVSLNMLTDVSVASAPITDQPLIYEAVGTVKAGISSDLASKLLGTQEKLALATYERYRDLKKQDLISAQNFEEREARPLYY